MVDACRFADYLRWINLFVTVFSVGRERLSVVNLSHFLAFSDLLIVIIANVVYDVVVCYCHGYFNFFSNAGNVII